MSKTSMLEPSWPGSVVPYRVALQAAGANPDALAHACPKCRNPDAVYATILPSGDHWLHCENPTCRWCGYGYDYLVDRHNRDLDLTFGGMGRAGKALRKKLKPNAMREYNGHVGQLRRFAEWACYVNNRRVAKQPGFFGNPHNPPHWWATTIHEWNAYCGVRGSTDVDPLPDWSTAIPGYDADYRVLGVAVSPMVSGGSWTRRCVPNTYGGMLFRSSIVPGQGCVICSSHGEALKLQIQYNMDSLDTLPVVSPVDMSLDLVPQIVQDLSRSVARPWIISVAGVSQYHDTPAAWLCLAKGLDARVSVYHAAAGGRAKADVAGRLGYSIAWPEAVLQAVQNLPDWKTHALLLTVGWSGVLEEYARNHWPAHEYAKARALATTLAETSVEIRQGLQVCDSPRGWICARTNKLLAEAAPTMFSVERNGRSKTYHGVVRYRGETISFSSRRFRRDPVGVVETTLLKAGVKDPPPPHPCVVPHMADLAAYFGRQVVIAKRAGEEK